MKKLLASLLILFTLLGCSNKGKESDVKSSDTDSLEEQISSVIAEHQLKNKEIIDYDLKDDFIYVIFKNKHESGNTHNPDLVILENKEGKVNWVAGPEDRTGSVDTSMIFAREDGPTVTITMPTGNTAVKEVKVLGESAKAVTYLEHFTDDFSRAYTYWISYTKEEPTYEDIEVITE
ncbi:hypothetical protein ACTNDN_22480 [Niallia sp. HCP3S3_B10]|uniref:hypothetical protein n=1 Tax=unclassified Niallia TaxID=2837522 RepID=UPI0020414C01|nr:hypothetical protein [Niallia sp. MER TA 168]MCM3361613.1 hypothetical protein [Niallia sp. MER TA 168]